MGGSDRLAHPLANSPTIRHVFTQPRVIATPVSVGSSGESRSVSVPHSAVRM